MSVTIEDPNGAITRYLDDVTEGAITATLFEVDGRLREITPIDTGFARNSWLVTMDENNEGNLGANPPGGEALKYSLEKVAYINNGAAYIRRLDNGHSQQAPGGMTGVVIPQIPRIIEREVQRRAE